MHLAIFGSILTAYDATPSSSLWGRSSPILVTFWTIVQGEIMGKDYSTRMIVPPGDVCHSGACCVAELKKENFPWSPRVPAPTLWQPLMPWHELFLLLVLSFGFVIVAMLGTFICFQVAWRILPRKLATRCIKLARGCWSKSHGPADEKPTLRRLRHGDRRRSAQLNLHELNSGVRNAKRNLQKHFADHFQDAAYETCADQVIKLLDSRARRLHGYKYSSEEPDHDGPADSVSYSGDGAFDDSTEHSKMPLLTTVTSGLALDTLDVSEDSAREASLSSSGKGMSTPRRKKSSSTDGSTAQRTPS